MRKVKISLSIIYWLIILALIVIAASTALSVFKLPGGINLFTVQSGSMEPTIKTGAAVLIQKQSIYKESDIITFLGSNKKDTTTHRISAIKNVNGEKIFTTKGDANRGEDRKTIKENQILGKMIFFIPYLGYAVSFAKTQIGFIFLIIVPAVIIIFSEILNIKKEILRIIEKRKIPDKTTKILTLLLLVGTILIFSTSTKAYLSDKEKSDNNVLQAGIWGTPEPSATPTITPTLTPTPTSIANHVVISEVQIATSGATTSDFIELYNPTSSTISLSGFRLVMRTNSGSTDTNVVVFDSGNSVPSHRFLLWCNTSILAALGCDKNSSDTVSNNNSVALRNGPVDTGTIIDAVTIGTPDHLLGEGTSLTAPAPNNSIERKALSTSTASTMAISGADEFKGNGYDTDNNINDFIDRTTPQPQNSSSPAEIP